MDHIENRGGARIGAGRKPKADEIKLIEKLSPLDDTALEVLKTLLENKDLGGLKLFMEYRWSKPLQKLQSDSNVNLTGINLNDLIKFQ
jgi:hypothetical protein